MKEFCVFEGMGCVFVFPRERSRETYSHAHESATGRTTHFYCFVQVPISDHASEAIGLERTARSVSGAEQRRDIAVNHAQISLKQRVPEYLNLFSRPENQDPGMRL